MKLKFNPNQQYQLDAISAVTDLFKGQVSSNYATFGMTGRNIENIEKLKSKNEGYIHGFSNTLTLSNKQINENLKIIQQRNFIDSLENIKSQGKNFSIEMETGTGKTYIYLRTIFELHKQYKFRKFIIVVPSIAIREGVIKSLDIMQSHFKELYNKVQFDKFVYKSKKPNLLRTFATNNTLQIMIINIDSFNKDTNIMQSERDQLGGQKPIKFIQATNPIVIIDEAQNFESNIAKEAIKSLNPLCTLRYSATHRDLYNQVYKLDTIQAFQKKLVKKISVNSVVEEKDATKAYIKVLKITNRNNKVTCTLEFIQNTKEGRNKIKKVCRNKDDLFDFSKKNQSYKNGFQIDEINCTPKNKFVKFANGNTLFLGSEQGGNRPNVIKIQIRETIKSHFDKEKQLKGLGIKVLSLFFLDKVENYRTYNNSHSNLGRYGKWFEEIYKEISKQYKDQLDITDVSHVHNGYFSKDKKGGLKNTKGNTIADIDTYSLIMKDKEKLLDIKNPLKFIFSHSALREGWDSPNVFQICTINDTGSVIKKRQEIGRGLRLPVNQNGERVTDDLINNLVVIANESYSEFTKNLQNELQTDSNIIFGKLPVRAFVGISIKQKSKEYILTIEQSKKIWNYLQSKGFLSKTGVIEEKFKHSVKNNTFIIPKEFRTITDNIISIMENYCIESHIRNNKTKVKSTLKKETLSDPRFKKFWKAISKKTFYSVYYKTTDLIKESSQAIRNMDRIKPLSIKVEQANITIQPKGLISHVTKIENYDLHYKKTILPNIFEYIQEKVPITKQTIFNILDQSKRLKDFTINPQKFMDQVVEQIKYTLYKLIVDGIKYEKLGTFYEMSQFSKEKHKMEFIGDKIVTTSKSVYNHIYYESNPEKKFVEGLEKMENIKYFIKMPSWFKVHTPVGEYNPDWAILKQNGNIVYMIRETKSSLKELNLRELEKYKTICGKKHFTSINIPYKTCTSIDDADL